MQVNNTGGTQQMAKMRLSSCLIWFDDGIVAEALEQTISWPSEHTSVEGASYVGEVREYLHPENFEN